MKPSEVMLKGIEAIEQHGWCQGDYTNADGQLCTRGGMVVGIGGEFQWRNGVVTEHLDRVECNPLYRRAVDRSDIGALSYAWTALTRVLREHGQHSDIIGFNDDPNTTQEDAILLMKEAAEQLAQEGQ